MELRVRGPRLDGVRQQPGHGGAALHSGPWPQVLNNGHVSKNIQFIGPISFRMLALYTYIYFFNSGKICTHVQFIYPMFRGQGVGRSACTVLSSTQMNCPSPAIVSAGKIYSANADIVIWDCLFGLWVYCFSSLTHSYTRDQFLPHLLISILLYIFTHQVKETWFYLRIWITFF